MAHRRVRSLLLLAVAVVLLSLGWDTAFAGKDGDGDLVKELGRIPQVWRQPHQLRLSHGGFQLDSAIQGGDQWDVSLSEAGNSDRPGIFASQLGTGKVAVGVDYDSTKSRFKPPAELHLKRAAFSAATKEGEGDDFDWTLHLEGAHGRHFSATGDQDSIAYDASAGLEVPVTTDLTALYALDAKRRAGASGFLPSWVRHSAGLSYASKLGAAKLLLRQSDPEADALAVDYEASLSGKLEGQPGSPKYVLRAIKDKDEDAAYSAKLQFATPVDGITGGVQLGLKGTEPSVSGYAELEHKHQVAKGLKLAADAKVVVTPGKSGEDLVVLHPVGLKASADLATFLPGVVTEGNLDVRTRYKVGAERPFVGFRAKASSKAVLPVQVEAEGQVDDEGKSSGSFRLHSAASSGLVADYEAISDTASGLRQAAQVTWPLPLQAVDANLYTRVTQSEKDHDGKPRLQVGVQYNGGANVAGHQVKLQGDSAGYDAGDRLIQGNGKPVVNVRLQRARKSASTLRNRIEGDDGLGYNWLRK